MVGGRRILLALGTLYVLLAVGWVLVGFADDASVITELIIFTLIAAPGVGLVYGGYQLPRADIRPEFYASIAGWCLGGLGIMAGILVLYDLQPGGGLTQPVQNGLILTALSSFAGFAAGIHDARAKTRTRELQETVKQLEESNERLEQFAYAASHDLQEPLRMVSSYLRLIENRYGDELDDDGQEFLEYAVDGADRMREMIQALLEYSRIETQAEPLEPVDLDDIFEDARRDLEVQIDESNAEITAESLPRVEGDADQLRQVFQNLLDNAIEYSGDEPPRIHVSAMRNGTEWTVSVRDEGIGIPPEEQDRIFEVFQRLHSREKYDGSGIGLALCERIIERHGGEMWVESEPGEGATFSFTLPVIE